MTNLPPSPVTRRLFALGAGALPLAGCSAVGVFNAFVPSDAGVERIAQGVAYGAAARQSLDLYAPTMAKGKTPSVLFLYGGGWSSGSRSEYGFVGRALASRGFLTAVADYRLVPQVRYPVFVEDSALALKWLRDHAAAYGGDPGELFIMGHSAGAYDAIMVALDPEFTQRAGLRGQVVKGAIGLAGPYDFLPLDVDSSREAFGQWPDLAQTQPVNHATSFAPPTFLAAGSADQTVAPRNTMALAQRLRARGRLVEEHIYPGLSHAGVLTALTGPFRGDAPVLEDVARFIRARAGA